MEENAENARTDKKRCEGVPLPPFLPCSGECQTRHVVKSAWISGVLYVSVPNAMGVRSHALRCSLLPGVMCCVCDVAQTNVDSPRYPRYPTTGA